MCSETKKLTSTCSSNIESKIVFTYFRFPYPIYKVLHETIDDTNERTKKKLY